MNKVGRQLWMVSIYEFERRELRIIWQYIAGTCLKTMNKRRKPQNSSMAKIGIRSLLNTECLSFCYRNMHIIVQLECNECLYTCLSKYKFFKNYIRNNSPPHIILITWIISLHAWASSTHTALTTPLPSISYLELTLNSSFPSLLPAVKTQTTLVTSPSLHAMKWPPSPCHWEW